MVLITIAWTTEHMADKLALLSVQVLLVTGTVPRSSFTMPQQIAQLILLGA